MNSELANEGRGRRNNARSEARRLRLPQKSRRRLSAGDRPERAPAASPILKDAPRLPLQCLLKIKRKAWPQTSPRSSKPLPNRSLAREKDTVLGSRCDSLVKVWLSFASFVKRLTTRPSAHLGVILQGEMSLRLRRAWLPKPHAVILRGFEGEKRSQRVVYSQYIANRGPAYQQRKNTPAKPSRIQSPSSPRAKASREQ